MKKVVIILLALVFCFSLFAADKVKVEKSVTDRNPNLANHSSMVPPTDDLFDLQFDWPVGVAGGEAGVECDGTYLYTSKWNGTVFYKYDLNGNYLEEFSVTGCPGALRDLCYDGQYFYGGAAANTVYQMDFNTQTTISTIAAPVAVRAIAYDADSDGFWANNWSTTITLFSRTGATLDTFECGVWSSYYGFAWDGYSSGGPYLWGYAQDGNTSNQLVQFDIATGLETGVNFDVGTVAAVSTGIAGGLCITDAFVAGYYTICGTAQNIDIWGLELCEAADPLAPGAPTNVSVVPNAGGTLQCTIGWTCPTLQVSGDPLTDLDEMRVYRDGVLIYTDTNPTIGGTSSYNDVAVSAAGEYSYKVVGYNDYEEGIPVSQTVWVGEDIPGEITNFIGSDASTTTTLIAQLDWTNPTAGYHGGYFAGCTGYDIVRVNDGQTFTVTGSATTWQDNTVPEANVYTYTITPLDASGSGPTTTSNSFGVGVSIAQVGNAESSQYNIPLNLWYQNSIVETVYDKEWIGSDMLINTIAFHTSSISSNVPPFDVEIWMGELDVDDLTGGWLDSSQLTMVYDGMVTVPTGADQWVEMSLDTPFEYEYANNLVVAIVKDDAEYYSTSDTWYTTESGTNARTIHEYSDSEEFSVVTPPTDVTELTTYPDVRFYYSALEHGTVEGTVTDSGTGNAISGAEVYVGSWGPATTNNAGFYSITGIVTGPQTVTAMKDGYYDFTGEVTVVANQTVTYNFVMDANLFGSLDGTVTDADTGSPLVGADIDVVSGAGYTYSTTTSNTGYYEITNVVAETYTVSCSFPDYPTGVVENVVVQDGQTTTVDFSLEGYAFWNDFESNNGQLLSNNTSGWQWGAFTSGPNTGYSGTNGWGTVIGGDYTASANWTLDTPVAYQVEAPNAALTFWHWYDIESSWDGGNVKISTDLGTTWSVITPLTGYTGTGNNSCPLAGEPIFCNTVAGDFWAFLEFDLSPYVGQNIMIRWHFGSDSSVQYAGWYIDDVAISGCVPPEQGSLTGTVAEVTTGNVIEGAVVTILGAGYTATSAADGTYTIPNLYTGTYDITCEAENYITAEHT
ncbi:MAG TPA: carboxypeptidase regulatory-like domain-containing protein, partial [Candidatus Cloacimonadota bacterium]|nr:carboxypeptidase regulatory-like domain-containing protein [Candidatus Cloacimonadota bacterium]